MTVLKQYDSGSSQWVPIVTGVVGATGPTGLTGATGVTGVTGATGPALSWTYYNTVGDLPSASANHGMFAHVHATGAAYYAHGGSWFELAKVDSPTFTGTPLAPTAAAGTNTTQLATTAFVTQAVPVGVINPYAGSTAPSGWLLCFGQAVSRTTYATLFAVLSTTYNTGVVAGTDFCLPDLRGRAVAGVDNMGGIDAGILSTANTLGTTTGTETITLATADIPAHAHANSLTNNAVTSGAGTSHNHGTTLTGTTTFAADGHSHAGQGSLAAAIGATNSQIASLGYVAGGNTGGPSTATYTIIGSVGGSGQAFNHYTPVYGSTGGNSSSASVGVSNTAESAHTHAVTSNVSISNVNAGGGGAHNNMPPTMVLNYIIKAL